MARLGVKEQGSGFIQISETAESNGSRGGVRHGERATLEVRRLEMPDMSLVITSRIVSNVVIVDVAGRLCFLDVTLRQHMKELFEEGHRAFVLNLANVPYVDSFGLGQLITISTSIQSKGGQLILLRPTDHVQALLRITKLNTVFNISSDEVQAVRRARKNSTESVLHAISAKSNLP